MTKITHLDVTRAQGGRSFADLFPQEKGRAIIRAYTHPGAPSSILLSDHMGADSAPLMRDLRAKATRFNERVWDAMLASIDGAPVGILVRTEPLDRRLDARLEAYALDGRHLASMPAKRQH